MKKNQVEYVDSEYIDQKGSQRFSLDIADLPNDSKVYLMHIERMRPYQSVLLTESYDVQVYSHSILWEENPTWRIYHLVEFFSLIKSVSTRFIWANMGLYKFKDKSEMVYGHANTLLVDRQKQTIERYEPHNTHPLTIQEYRQDLLDLVLSTFIISELNGYTYIRPMDYSSKLLSLQIEIEPKQKVFPKGGLCALFSSMYTEYRMKFPSIPRRTLILDLTKKMVQLHKSDQLDKYLAKYVYRFQKSLLLNFPEVNEMLSDELLCKLMKLPYPKYPRKTRIDTRIVDGIFVVAKKLYPEEKTSLEKELNKNVLLK